MPSKHNHDKKQNSEVPASQANTTQIQEQLAHYQSIAAALDTNTAAAQDEETLAPITSLDENTQLALVKELEKEHTTEAANVLQALYMYAPGKAVRKEVRRSLIRLEASKLYPEWEPPTVSLLDSMSKSLFPLSNEEEEDDNDDDNESEEGGFLSDLQSQLASFLPVSPIELIVSSFLQAWAEGDYKAAYDCLATNSSLREELARSEWISRRKQWRRMAQPKDIRIQFVKSVEDDLDYPQTVEAGWSLTLIDTTLDTPLPELPTATMIYPETGRRWFWSRYRIVENKYIQEITDEGARAFNLSEDELTQRIEEVTQLANERLQDLQDKDDEDEDLDLDEVADNLDEDENLDLDEDLDDLDEDEDEDDIEGMMGLVQEAFSITSVALSYCDALIARSSVAEPIVYETPYNLATAIMDRERAAAYMSIMAEKLPDKRGEALTELASTFSLMASQYEEEGNIEQTGHFITLAEQNLRESITLINAPRSKILLAQVLLAQNKQFEEAESLLLQAKSTELDPKLETLADVSLARLAQERGENEQALNYYMEAATIRSDFPGLWLYIGHLQAELGQFDNAEQSLLRNVEQDPETVDAYLELATIYSSNKQDLQKAEFIIAQGLEAIPDSADLLVAQAIILINKGELRQAQQFLDEAEEIDPEVELLQEARALLQQYRQSQNQARRAKPKQHKRKR